VARHAARVTPEGRLVIADLASWARALKRQKGREVWLSLGRVQQEGTTLDQHGYYRAVLLPMAAEEWGWGDPAELHYRLKEKHLPPIVPLEEWPRRHVGGEWRLEPPSMADLTKEQSAAFLQRVIDQMTDAGIAVPPPRGSEAA
jgi:hypothetical protein